MGNGFERVARHVLIPNRRHVCRRRSVPSRGGRPGFRNQTFAVTFTIMHTLWNGPLADHMAAHIVLMNLVAPFVALVVANGVRSLPSRPIRQIAAAATLQILLLWGWHAPGVLEWALHSMWAHLAMQLSLFAVAFWFWTAVFCATGADRWRSLFALLVSGKMFCLLAVLFVFSPRALYPGLGHGGLLAPMPDQQLAGLMMLVACPLSYLVAAVVISARWLKELDLADRTDAAFALPRREA